MPVPPRPISPELLAEGRRLYEQTRVAVDDIAAMLGIGARTFHTRLRTWGWRRRVLRVPQGSPPAAPQIVAPPIAAEPAPLPPADPQAFAAHAAVLDDNAPTAVRIQRTIERELHAVEQIVARLRPSERMDEAERAARVLAFLARTLQEVKRLSNPVPAAGERTDNDRGPADPDEFFRALVRRMDEFAGRAQGAVPDGASAALE